MKNECKYRKYVFAVIFPKSDSRSKNMKRDNSVITNKA